jgi:hypothetical protein
LEPYQKEDSGLKDHPQIYSKREGFDSLKEYEVGAIIDE